MFNIICLFNKKKQSSIFFQVKYCTILGADVYYQKLSGHWAAAG